MAYPFRNILCPMDFDENALMALDVARQIAQDHDGTLHLLHVVPIMIVPPEVPVYREVYRPEEEAALKKLQDIANERLKGRAKYTITTRVGDAAKITVQTAAELSADVVVMATHGRTGLPHLFLGSVAERVVRESPCPVLTIRAEHRYKGVVGERMAAKPVTVSPADTLATARTRMREGGFHSIPVTENGKLVGIISDADIVRHEGYLDKVRIDAAMSKHPVTVSASTSLEEAAKLMLQKKTNSLPVVENGKLVGIITTSDVLRTFVATA